MEILSLITSNYSSDAIRILLYLQEVQQATIENLAKILQKSPRTVYRYIKELSDVLVQKNFYYSLSNLSSVVVNFNKSTTTKDQDQNTLEWHDKVGDLLDKYGKKLLLDEVLKRIPEQNINALEYLLKDAVNKEKHRQIKTNFTRYFLWSILNRFDEAVFETRQPEEVIQYIHSEEKIELPQADPEAQIVWNEIINNLDITSFKRDAWFKTAIPIRLNNNRVVLTVLNPYAKEKILEQVCDKVEFVN